MFAVFLSACTIELEVEASQVRKIDYPGIQLPTLDEAYEELNPWFDLETCCDLDQGLNTVYKR